MQKTNQPFSKNDYFNLFLVSAFPLHLWTILMMMRDINWVAERSTTWDAVGFSGYAMLYTLVESVFLFGFIVLLSLLLPRHWNRTLRFGVLSLVAFVLAGWSIMEQLILIIFWGRLQALPAHLPILASGRWVPLTLTAILVTLSIAVPLALLRKSEKLQKNVASILERLTILSGLYLFLDTVALVVVLVRNLT